MGRHRPIDPVIGEQEIDRATQTRTGTASGNPLDRLGLGISGPLGAAWFDEEKAHRLIAEAISLGIRTFDTGPLYGLAEQRLGTVLRTLSPADRHGLRVSTKVGNFLDANGKRRRDFSADAIRRILDQSLTRLGLEAVDILYLHGPDEHELIPSLAVLEDLKQSGLISRTGVCSEGSHLERAAREKSVDCLMGTYNILDRRHADLFREASSGGQHVTAIAPLAQGLYRRGFLLPRSPSDAWYIARALVRNRDSLRKGQDIGWLHDIDGWDAPSLALAFVLANPAVDRAMLTTTRAEHLRANVVAANRRLPHDLMIRLAAIGHEA